MCRWLAYSGRPIYLEQLIENPRNSLIKQSLNASESKTSINGDGFGIGWYANRSVPGLYREVLPAWADQNLLSLSKQISSSRFFAHVRASTGTYTSRANCHPFSVENWLFMHNGQIAQYEKIRRQLEALIPDHYYCYREGTTDSEALFLALFGLGVKDDPIGALTRLCQTVNKLMDAQGVTEAFRFTAALSDGNSSYAFRYSSDAWAPSLYYRTTKDGVGVVIASEPLDISGERWVQVQANHGVTVNVNNQLDQFALDIH